MAAWLIGLIVLFFCYALVVAAGKKTPKPPGREISDLKFEIPEKAESKETEPRMRRKDRERIERALSLYGRTVRGDEADDAPEPRAWGEGRP